jgi:hypothetical protein
MGLATPPLSPGHWSDVHRVLAWIVRELAAVNPAAIPRPTATKSQEAVWRRAVVP